ncbi:hypothetical protein Sta7437_4356 [Stanieria cyanosphaera PCC 7437]|uniref:Uncharacterized protein n=1 Tax=Stanieria cyanosphaera (strain ATCC 29371 / PCC 7437) TaxID=111780 RepID=K9XYZ8_STAC7|nr:hypothetical protein [Stanieria cyanosphaera]AFZ37825.1 hypothetical protein Sta7437_4356 [Stanieria cyanosphaera PCC 7437]
MLSPAINIESLPKDKQDKIVEHLKEYIQDLQDEQKCKNYFDKTQDKLIASAKLAKQQIAEEKATPIDYNKL